MLNDIKNIKELWPGENVNIDDETKDASDKTAYDRFLERAGAFIARRLKKWVGDEAYDDAAAETPTDPERAECLEEAEFQLFHVQIIEKLWRDKSAGAERDVQFPSGSRITLEAFSSDAYQALIETHTKNAERAVMEYM